VVVRYCSSRLRQSQELSSCIFVTNIYTLKQYESTPCLRCLLIPPFKVGDTVWLLQNIQTIALQEARPFASGAFNHEKRLSHAATWSVLACQDPSRLPCVTAQPIALVRSPTEAIHPHHNQVGRQVEVIGSLTPGSTGIRKGTGLLHL